MLRTLPSASRSATVPLFMQLTLDLTDGFQHDHVIVSIDDRELLNAPDLTTHSQLGRALRLTHTVDREGVALLIALPRRGIRAERTLGLHGSTYVRVILDEYGTLHLIPQPTGTP